MHRILAVVNPALLMTFFSNSQSTFLQCYSVALSKRLISGSALNLVLCNLDLDFIDE